MSRPKRDLSTKRLNIIILIVIGAGTLIAFRIFFLQIIKYKTYREAAYRQQNSANAFKQERGKIYFKKKDGSQITAATTETGYILYLNTKKLENSEDALKRISEITEVDTELFQKISEKKDDPYEILKNRLSIEEGEKIKALKLPGVEVASEKWRFYPNGSLGSHVLGFVPTISGKIDGEYGAEKQFNAKLRNENLFLANDINLTIEPLLQELAESELKKIVTKWKAKSAGMIIVEPENGKIRAMAAIPNFDPNNYQKEKKLEIFLNPFVEKIFEMGSVFKPLTIVSAIDTGAITPETTYIDKGEIKIGIATIKNFDGKARGKVDMLHVLEESLNTGAVFAMQKLGGENLKDYFYKFGLGEKLGIELPGELRGNLSNLNSGREIEFATASFGQGIAVTPLELTMALGTLANKGKLMRPLILDSSSPEVIRTAVKPESAETVTKMLVTVVDKALAGGKAKMDGYSIAAKTGTAQIPKKDGGGYGDEYLHTFFGYFPAYEPRFLIFIFLEQPHGVKYASQSLTDTFSNTVKFLINYYIIPPDR